MADNLESRIGTALRATHFQMQMSDAKEGLSYMHEQVEALRQFGNPMADIEQFYGLHFELSSFLRHLGFAEFSEESLRQICDFIVTSVYHPKVKDDPIPRANTIFLREEEQRLQGELSKAEQWVTYFATHDPTEYPDDQTMIRSVSTGAYFEGNEDLVATARFVQSELHQAELIKKMIDSFYRAASEPLQKRMDQCLEELDRYAKEKPGLAKRLTMIVEGRFRIPGSGVFSAMNDALDLMAGNYAGIRFRIERKKHWERNEYLDIFPDVRRKLEKAVGGIAKPIHAGFPSLEFLSLFEGFGAAERRREYAPALFPGEIFPEQKMRDQAVYGATPDILYYLSRLMENFQSRAEKKLDYCVQEIKKQHPKLVEAWSKKKEDAQEQLRNTVENKDGWGRAWRINFDGVQESEQLRTEAISHPWLANRHPIYNTSAYSAKLTALSVQLEAIQSGVPIPGRRLLT